MNKQRAMELLNAVIENLLVAESPIAVIEYLLHIGFEKTELVEDFNFSIEDDVKEVSTKIAFLLPYMCSQQG